MASDFLARAMAASALRGGGGGDVKIYQHNISIMGTDRNNNSYTVRYIIYSTKSDSLFSDAPTVSEVKNVIRATCLNSVTPDFYTSTQSSYNVREYMYVDMWTDEALYGNSTDMLTGTSTSGAISNINWATDTVVEM